MNILLITRYFPPLDSIATHRMYAWAIYLKQFGAKVTVLTTDKRGQVVIPYEWDTSGIEVLEVDYWDPILACGFSKQGEFQEQAGNGVLQRFKEGLKRFYRQRMNERIPSRTDSWYRPAKRCLDEMARAGRQFDIVISSYGPPVCHRLGFYAKKRFQAKWMADYRDMWIENHCYRGLWPFTLLETYLERRWVKNADLLSTVSEPLRCALAQKFPHVQTETLYNGYEPRLIDSCAAEKKDPKDSRLRILYTGSVYLHSRNPRPLFEALVQLRKEGHVLSEQFDIRFYSSHSGAVSSLIREYDLGDCVAELGYVSQEKAYALQKGADLLLFLDCVHPNLDGILTGKLFEYLYAPTPILLVGGRGRSSSCQVIAQAEAGFVCGSDVAQIKKVLSEALQRRPTVCKKQDVVQAFSREAQARKLYRLLCALRQR